MTRLLQRLIASALLSIGMVAATVGVSYGQDKVVRIGFQKAVAEQLAPAIGLSVPVVEVALERQSYGIKPITESVIADQQQVADTFFALGLIPKQIKISEVARRSGS